MRAPVTSIFRTVAKAASIVLLLVGCVVYPSLAQAESPYIRGLELYRKGSYQEAEKVLRAALPEPPPPPPAQPGPLPLTPPPPPPPQPEEAHVRAMLGFTLLRGNHLADAEEQFSLVRRSHEPDSLSFGAVRSVGALGQGWAAFARGRTSEAVEILTDVLKRPAKSSALPDMLAESVPADAQFALGLIALGRGDAKTAQRHLEAATKGQDVLSSPKELYLALGDARAQSGDASGARSAWAEVARHASRFPGDAPRDELSRLKTARLLESSGDSGAALSLYAELSGGKHYQVDALQGQARVLLARGNAEAALPVLKKLVVLEPMMAEPMGQAVETDARLRPLLKDWGLAYFHRASYMEALAKFSRYLDDVDARDYACLMGQGWSQLRLGNGEQARDAFTEALKDKPGDSDPLAGLGSAALVLGKKEEARTLLGKAVEADRSNAVALNSLGHLEMAAGNGDVALTHFRASLSLRADYADSRLAIARILFDRAEFDAAASEYFRLATQEKRSVAAWSGLGWARLRLGQYDDALQAFAEARRVAPNQPVAAYGMAMALAKKGQADKAAQRLAEAIFLNPDFAGHPRGPGAHALQAGVFRTVLGNGRGLRAQAVPHCRRALP